MCWCSICRYNTLTGIFTVPTGGAGLYYFSSYFLVDVGEYATFSMFNGNQELCRAHENKKNSGADYAQAGCSGMAELPDGKFTGTFVWRGRDSIWVFWCVMLQLSLQELRSRWSMLQELTSLHCWQNTLASLDSESEHGNSTLDCPPMMSVQIHLNVTISCWTFKHVWVFCPQNSVQKYLFLFVILTKKDPQGTQHSGLLMWFYWICNENCHVNQHTLTRMILNLFNVHTCSQLLAVLACRNVLSCF